MCRNGSATRTSENCTKRISHVISTTILSPEVTSATTPLSSMAFVTVSQANPTLTCLPLSKALISF